MDKFALINQTTGLVESILMPSSPSQFVDGNVYGGFKVIKIPEKISDEDARSMHLSASGKSLNAHERKKHESDKWDVSQKKYVPDIGSHAQSEYDALKFKLYLFITKTSDFPEWKQANYADTGSDLGFKEITGTITNDEQSKLNNIRLIRQWKNTLLAERDRVKAAIFSANNAAQIELEVNSMVYTPPPFSL